MIGGCNMRGLCALVVILIPLGVMVAPAGMGSLSVPDRQAQWGTLAVTALDPLPQGVLPKGSEPFLLAVEGTADVTDRGEEESGDQEKKEGGEEEGEGGWDRLWDAPKLG
jgi:hypothetical protein